MLPGMSHLTRRFRWPLLSVTNRICHLLFHVILTRVSMSKVIFLLTPPPPRFSLSLPLLWLIMDRNYQRNPKTQGFTCCKFHKCQLKSPKAHSMDYRKPGIFRWGYILYWLNSLNTKYFGLFDILTDLSIY